MECGWETYILDGDKAIETFALDGMWMSDNSSFSYKRMLNQDRLDISCTQQVTRYIQHVINASRDPQITVTVTLRTWYTYIHTYGFLSTLFHWTVKLLHPLTHLKSVLRHFSLIQHNRTEASASVLRRDINWQIIRLRGIRKLHLATSHNLATPLSYTNFTSQPHKY